MNWTHHMTNFSVNGHRILEPATIWVLKWLETPDKFLISTPHDGHCNLVWGWLEPSLLETVHSSSLCFLWTWERKPLNSPYVWGQFSIPQVMLNRKSFPCSTPMIATRYFKLRASKWGHMGCIVLSLFFSCSIVPGSPFCSCEVCLSLPQIPCLLRLT